MTAFGQIICVEVFKDYKIMSNILDVSTKNQYQFFPVANGFIRFKVKTAHDAHIVLSNGANDTNPMYEIIIGGWANTKSVIRKNKIKPEKAEVETPGILSNDEFRQFWIRWDGDEVQVGKNTGPDPFLKFADPEPFPKTFVGVGTGWGSTGIWKFEDGTEISTPDSGENFNYNFLPVKSGYMRFEYRGPNSAQICLTRGPKEVEPMFEINLGMENNKSSIRYRREVHDEVTMSTPVTLHAEEFKTFEIHWTDTRVLVRDGTGKVLMEWHSAVMFPVSHFGLRTGNGKGQWRVHYFPSAPSFLRAASKA